jgi:hypothetical protein
MSVFVRTLRAVRQCGLRIDDDTAALRQVAALVRCEGARPVIHLRDLGTSLPFHTEDGAASAGVIADGPLHVAMGSVAVWFLPCPLANTPVRADEAWSALAPRTFLDRLAPEAADPARRSLSELAAHHSRTSGFPRGPRPVPVPVSTGRSGNGNGNGNGNGLKGVPDATGVTKQ